jgi:hypothetical protein
MACGLRNAGGWGWWSRRVAGEGCAHERFNDSWEDAEEQLRKRCVADALAVRNIQRTAHPVVVVPVVDSRADVRQVSRARKESRAVPVKGERKHAAVVSKCFFDSVAVVNIGVDVSVGAQAVRFVMWVNVEGCAHRMRSKCFCICMIPRTTSLM